MKTTYQLTKYIPDTGLFSRVPKPWVNEFIDYTSTYIEVLEGEEALQAVSSYPLRRTLDYYSFKIGDKIQLPNILNSKQFKYFTNERYQNPKLNIYCYYHEICSNQIYPIKLNTGLLIQYAMNRNTKERIQTNGQITQYINSSMTESEAWTNLLGKTLIIMDVTEVPFIRYGFNGQPNREMATNIYTINVENTINPIPEDIEVKFLYKKDPEEKQSICSRNIVVSYERIESVPQSTDRIYNQVQRESPLSHSNNTREANLKSIELKLQKLVPAIFNYLKVNKPNGGVIDVATLGAQVVNYWVNQKEISMSERVTAKLYLCHLIGLAFKNPIPEHILVIIRELMIYETEVTSTAKILAERV